MTQSELATQFTGKAVEAFSIFAETNQRVLQELADLMATTARENVRLYGELQSTLVQAAREHQAALLDGLALCQDAQKDPFGWYQKGLLNAVEGTQKAFRLLEANAQAVTRTAERLQGSAERTGKEIQEAITASASRVKDLYAQG